MSQGFGVGLNTQFLTLQGIVGDHYFYSFEIWGEPKSVIWADMNKFYNPRLTGTMDANLLSLIVADSFLFSNLFVLDYVTQAMSVTFPEDINL